MNKSDEHDEHSHDGCTGDHDHDHEHHHVHEHSAEGLSTTRVMAATAMNLIITIAELLGGLLSGSLSLISDALHNFSDGIALVISWIAMRISQRGADGRQTFGYRRAGILAALFNACFLLGVSVLLVREAIERLLHPVVVNGPVVLIVASIGLVANLIAVLLLKRGAHHDMNIRSAYLHLLSDTLSSVAVIIGAVVMSLWGINLVDPILTLLINAYILREVILIIKKAAGILMQSSPSGIDPAHMAEDICRLDSVAGVHHLHVWALDEKRLFFEAHIRLKQDIPVSKTESVQHEIEHLLEEKYGIGHVTIQFEFGACGEEGLFVHHA